MPPRRSKRAAAKATSNDLVSEDQPEPAKINAKQQDGTAASNLQNNSLNAEPEQDNTIIEEADESTVKATRKRGGRKVKKADTIEKTMTRSDIADNQDDINKENDATRASESKTKGDNISSKTVKSRGKSQSPSRDKHNSNHLTSALGLSLENTPEAVSKKRLIADDVEDSPSLVPRLKKSKNFDGAENESGNKSIGNKPKKIIQKPWKVSAGEAATAAALAAIDTATTNTTTNADTPAVDVSPDIPSATTTAPTRNAPLTFTAPASTTSPAKTANSNNSPSKHSRPLPFSTSRSAASSRPRSTSPVKTITNTFPGHHPAKYSSVPGSDSAVSLALTSFTANANSELTAKFEKLRDLKETKAERLLREFKEAAEARFEAADDLIRDLTEQQQTNPTDQPLMEATLEIQTLQQSVADISSDLEAANEEIALLRAKLEAKENQQSKETNNLALGICSDLSGLVVLKVKAEADITTYECVQSGRNGVFRYDLSLAKPDGPESRRESQDITFTPLLTEKDEHLISLLPDYFTEPLSFTREAVSIIRHIYASGGWAPPRPVVPLRGWQVALLFPRKFIR